MKRVIIFFCSLVAGLCIADELPQRYHFTNVKIFNGWDEKLVEGDVIVEGMIFPSSNRELLTLATRLTELRQAADSSGSELIVNIMPDDEVLHGRIIDVMNACAIAQVQNTSFTMEM